MIYKYIPTSIPGKKEGRMEEKKKKGRKEGWMEKGPRRREKNVMKGKEEEKNIKNKRVQETGIRTIPMEKKCKKAKWLSREALQIAEKRRKVKSKGERERYTQLDSEF